MYVLNADRLRSTARQQGYTGLTSLLRLLGLSRSALQRFTEGAPVLPKSVAAVAEALDMPIEQVVVKVSAAFDLSSVPVELASKLHRQFNSLSFFLFGSRARGQARKYSDFDLGVYSSAGVQFENYLELVKLKEQYEEESPYYFDLVDLTKADSEFVREISGDLRLLAGYYSDLMALKQRVLKIGEP